MAWKKELIREVLQNFESGGRPKGGVKDIESGIPSIGGEHLNSNGDFDFSNLKYVPEAFYKSLSRGIIKKEDVLIVKDGATTGKTSFVGTNFPYNKAAVNEHVFLARVNQKIVAKLLFYYLFSLEGQLQLKNCITGTAQGGINLSILDKISIRYPESKAEQEAIVSEIEKQFTRLDESIKSLRNVRNKLVAYRASVLNSAFYGKEMTLPELVSQTKNSIKRGPFGGSLKKEIFVKEGYLVYEQRHAIHNDFVYKKYFITKEKYDEMKMFRVEPSDLIISCSGVTLGRISEIPKNAQPGIINQALLKITLDNSKVLNKYFIYLFQSDFIHRYIKKLSRGVAIPNVPSVKDLKKIRFPIPSITEQVQILQVIESSFSVINKVERTVDQSILKAEKLRESILKAAFEGRLVKFEEGKITV